MTGLRHSLAALIVAAAALSCLPAEASPESPPPQQATTPAPQLAPAAVTPAAPLPERAQALPAARPAARAGRRKVARYVRHRYRHARHIRAHRAALQTVRYQRRCFIFCGNPVTLVGVGFGY